MKSQFVTYFLLISLVLGAAPQAGAATVAEAATGNEKVAIGQYDVSGMSPEEREWFVTFLKGNLFCDGWERIAANILMNTAAPERELQRVRLDRLGYKIGREWSRRNNDRKIDISMLRKWGMELKDTAKNNSYRLTETVLRIDKEVDELLN